MIVVSQSAIHAPTSNAAVAAASDCFVTLVVRSSLVTNAKKDTASVTVPADAEIFSRVTFVTRSYAEPVMRCVTPFSSAVVGATMSFVKIVHPLPGAMGANLKYAVDVQR